MNNSMNPLNTNISGISNSKTINADSSFRKSSKKIRPTTSHNHIKIRKNLTKSNSNISKPSNMLFSLKDIKSQFYSKAPSVPNQYKRKIYSKLDKFLYDKNSKQNLSKVPQIECDNKNEANLIYKKLAKIKTKTQSRKERLYKPVCWDNADMKDIKKNQRDKLMPEGYEFFEKVIVDCNNSFVKNNYVKVKEPTNYILIRKLNQLNNYKSNIFFLNNSEINKSYYKTIESEKRKNLYLKYRDSDIFNLRKDKNIIDKSGEYSYFRQNPKNNIIYNANNETLLGWKLRKPLPSYMNYTSSKFNLFNRDMPNIGQTKEKVIEETRKLSESFNPSHKQKGLTEFIHLSRVSATNINEDYNKALKENPNIFKRKNDFSSEFYDIYNKYNSLCERPFPKFKLFN